MKKLISLGEIIREDLKVLAGYEVGTVEVEDNATTIKLVKHIDRVIIGRDLRIEDGDMMYMSDDYLIDVCPESNEQLKQNDDVSELLRNITHDIENSRVGSETKVHRENAAFIRGALAGLHAAGAISDELHDELRERMDNNE